MAHEQDMLMRLEQHRRRMAEAGNIAQARFDKSQNDAITREIQLYWRDMTEYYEREHDG